MKPVNANFEVLPKLYLPNRFYIDVDLPEEQKILPHRAECGAPRKSGRPYIFLSF